MTVIDARVFTPRRLAAVRRTGLLDTPAEEPFDRLTRLACELLGTPFGFVTVVDERRSFWKSCIGITATDPRQRQNTVEQSFCQYVIAADDKLIVDDARLNPLTATNPSIESMGVVAWAGFPLRSPDGEVLGTFCVVDTRPRHWSARDVSVLEVLAHAASGEIALRTSLDDARTAARRAQTEATRATELAGILQESLLPSRLPVVDGLDIAAVHAPGRGGGEVLGDFYDVVPSINRSYGAFVGDVCGKGPQAARTTALARYTLRASALQHSSPAVVLRELHAALAAWFTETDSTGFLTAVYASLTPAGDDFAVRICSAGHPPALVRRADGTVETVPSAGTLLGMLPKVDLRVHNDSLRPGDSLIMYTDGATEARHHRTGDLLDPAGLLDLVATVDYSRADSAAAGLLSRVLEHSTHPPSDDIAIMVVQVPQRRAAASID